MSLLTPISSQKETLTGDIQGLKTIVDIPNDTSIASIFRFNPIKASDFPEFGFEAGKIPVLYSTDHSESGAQGGCWWSYMDTLDGRNFQEGGLIIGGHQAESPVLFRLAEALPNGDVIGMYYHTKSTDPNHTPGSTAQETMLMTTQGGALPHECTWNIQTPPPLGIVTSSDDYDLGGGTEETHTGYLVTYPLPNGLTFGVHLQVIDSVAEDRDQRHAYSISEDGGLTFYRAGRYNTTIGGDGESAYAPNNGTFFDKYGQKWFLGTQRPIDRLNQTGQQLIIAKADPFYNIYELCKILNNEQRGNTWSAYIPDDSDIAHVYYNNDDVDIQHATYNLRNLFEFL